MASATDPFAALPSIAFEGPETENELAYRYYDKNRVVLGKTMAEHLRFAVCMWHTFNWPGSDVFGAGTFDRPWLTHGDAAEAAAMKREAAFAFVRKLDLPFYCFHDVDVMEPAATVSDYQRRFADAIDHLERLQDERGSSCYGVPPISSPIRGMPLARRPARTRRCSRGAHFRSARRLRLRIGLAAPTTCCGAAAKAMKR